jgi:hypothetical protein
VPAAAANEASAERGHAREKREAGGLRDGGEGHGDIIQAAVATHGVGRDIKATQTAAEGRRDEVDVAGEVAGAALQVVGHPGLEHACGERVEIEGQRGERHGAAGRDKVARSRRGGGQIEVERGAGERERACRERAGLAIVGARGEEGAGEGVDRAGDDSGAGERGEVVDRGDDGAGAERGAPAG